MIQRLRRKFVLVLMSAVTLFLAVLLVGMYVSNAAHYRQSSFDTLRTAVIDGERARGSMPLVVAEVAPDGQVRVLLNQIYFLTDADIAAAITEAQNSNPASGELPDRNLRYLRLANGPGQVRYAFADTYGETRSLHAQAVYSAMIGAAAFLGLLIFSVILSGWIVRPVQEAWTKQRQFVADASHELKTPLTVALSNVEMALSASGSVPDGKNRRRLDITKIELLRMKGLVEKLLVLARADVDDGQISAQPLIPVDFSYLLTCSVSSFEPLFFDAGRQLHSEIVPGCCVTGNPEKLSELISILLDNACKYSFADSVITVCLTCDSRKWVHLTVENDGKEIPTEDLPRIFDRFFRVDQSRGEISGHGLGLSIAKEITSQHSGTLQASSESGHTTFLLSLPVHQ